MDNKFEPFPSMKVPYVPKAALPFEPEPAPGAPQKPKAPSGRGRFRAAVQKLKEQKPMTKRQRIVCLILFSLHIASMSLSWFGGARGVQEVKGFVVLHHPVALVCAALILWGCIASKRRNYALIGCAGLLLYEAFHFMTWYMVGINSRFDLPYAFRMAYPEFYIGFLLLAVLTLTISKKRRG